MLVPSYLIACRLAPSSKDLLVRYLFLSALLFSLSALAQRRGTRSVRLALVPLLYVGIWSFTGGINFQTHCFNFFNYIMGVGLVYLALLVPRLAFLSEPYTHSDPSLVGSTTIDLLTNPALTLWNETSYYKPPPSPPLEEIKTAREHAVACVKDAAIIGAICLPGVKIWGMFERNEFEDNAIGTACEGGVVLILGLCVAVFVDLIYQLSGAVSVGLLGWDRKTFPETFDKPWSSTSVHEFWAKRWHNLLAPTFAFYSQAPIPKPVQPFIVFFISGALHDLGLVTLTNSLAPSLITLFFTVQFFGAGLESVWRQVTGKRVGGWGGFIWTFAFLAYTGRWVCRGWADKGVVTMAIETTFFWLRKANPVQD